MSALGERDGDVLAGDAVSSRSPSTLKCALCLDPAYLCTCDTDIDAAAGVSPETEPAAAKEAP